MARRLEIITDEGKKFIRKVCKGSKNDLLRGENGPLPFSDDGNGKPVNKSWISNAKFDDGKSITTNEELGEALIDWFEYYGNMYELDPNVLAAQAYVESKYRIWYYTKDTDASGINQFTMAQVYSIVINNFSDVRPLMWTENENLNSALIKITKNLDDELSSSSYQPNTNNGVTSKVARLNRPQLHQNIIDNPQIMIKAQARYMRFLSDNCGKLASGTLLSYKCGTAYMANTYSKVIQNIKYKKGVDSFLNDGLDYVLKIFGVLGDKDNRLKASFGDKYKINENSFGYSDLFKHNGGDDLLAYPNVQPNGNFDPYNANVEESKEYGIEKSLLDNLTIARDSRYKQIYFPESEYVKEKILNKKQIVLHHTVSGDKGGVSGDIKWWRNKSERIATTFIVSREGEIFQLFNTDFWAHHLGIKFDFIKSQGTDKTNTYLNQHSIGIEIDSWGGLVEASDGKWYPTVYVDKNDLQSYTPRKNAESIPESKIQFYNEKTKYPKGFRGFYGFEKYTDKQIKAVRDLIQSLTYNNLYKDNGVKGFKDITLKYNDDIWDLTPQGKATGCYGVSKNALNGKAGVWTHTSYRNDKSDCHPQPQLIEMLKSLEDGSYNKDFEIKFLDNSN